MDAIKDMNATVQGLAKTVRRTAFVRLWRLGLIALVLLHLFPIRTGILRSCIVVLCVGVWTGFAALFCSARPAKVGWALVSVGALLILLGPGRPIDSAALRQEYVNSLHRYTGVRYIWGGESSRGIDCSGLVRTGLIDADFRSGFLTMNPALIRRGVALWWFDCSAEALKGEYRGATSALFDARDLNHLEYDRRILPGDFCVTESGHHTMAYVGEGAWIEADPHEGRVIILKSPSSNMWLDQPMQIMRWRQLQ